MSWASVVVGAGTLIYGAVQKGKAKKSYNAIPDAPYEISSLYKDNVGLSENRAQTGWSADSVNFYTSQLQQGLQSSNSAMLQAGGGINDFAKSYAAFTTGIKSFALEGDQMKSKNIAQLISDRSALAREETQQWAINKYKKMQDQKAAAALMLSNAQSTMNSGLNMAIGGGVNAANYYMQNRIPKDSEEEDTGKPIKDSNYYINTKPTASSTDYLQGGETDYSKFFNQNNMWGNP